MEDKGWDPYLESRGILEDLNAILQSDYSDEIFPDKDFTMWRMGLLMYSHIVEMDAPYEVITNLLRFRLGKGYSPNPFYMFLNNKDKRQFKHSGIYPHKKIKIIKMLSEEAGISFGDIFEFYDSKLRNAISHSDYVLTDKQFSDHADPTLKRHLLRMWIALPDKRRRALSPLLDDRYRYVELGGIAKWEAA